MQDINRAKAGAKQLLRSLNLAGKYHRFVTLTCHILKTTLKEVVLKNLTHIRWYGYYLIIYFNKITIHI